MGSVYVAKCGDYYKIGYTGGTPAGRIKALQTGNPFPITLVGSIPASSQDEEHLHAMFADKRVRGEWFALTLDDLASILSGRVLPEPPWMRSHETFLRGLSLASQRWLVAELKKLREVSLLIS